MHVAATTRRTRRVFATGLPLFPHGQMGLPEQALTIGVPIEGHALPIVHVRFFYFLFVKIIPLVRT